MHSDLFDQANREIADGQSRFALQNGQMLRVSLGPDVLATKGAMVAFQGTVEFHHEKAGGMGKLLKKMVTSEDNPLMRVTGQGEVFFASRAGFVNLVELTGDAISVNGRNLLAFDAALDWDIHRTKGAGVLAGGLFNTTVSGTGMVALHTIGQPVVLDCSQQPTYVDTQACVAWSAGLTPKLVSSMKFKSMLRGGSGEAFQYAFEGPGFVVVQADEWESAQGSGGKSGGPGGLIGDFMGG
ncbi:MAG: AIM24 family protein [Nocardioides sp.]